MCGGGTLLNLEVHLANDAAVFFVLFANERTKIRTAHFYRIEPGGGKFRPYVESRRPGFSLASKERSQAIENLRDHFIGFRAASVRMLSPGKRRPAAAVLTTS
jgi:hypothetical protein